MRLRRPQLVIACAVLLYTLLGAWTLPSYGATWDEPENFYSGEAQLHFLWSGEGRFMDFSHNQLPRNEAFLYWAESDEVWRYPPATNILAAAIKHVLSDGLRVARPIDGYHFVIVLLGAALVAAVMSIACARHGLLPALFAGAALGLHPRFFSDLHDNIKDLPEAAWFTFALLSAFHAHSRRSLRAWIASGIFWGLALATKPNALGLPLLFAIWLAAQACVRWRNAEPAPESLRMLASRATLALLLGLVTALAAWPWLWWDGPSHVVERVGQYVDYLRFVGVSTKGWDMLAPYYLGIVTPPWVLLLALIGAVAVLDAIRRRERGDGLELLLLLWVALPLLRLCAPEARFYDGIRHFLEVLPALSLLAANGFAWLLAQAQRAARAPRLVGAVMAVISGVALAWPLVEYHPHENVYFNAFVGGYAGARARKIPWASEYWGGSMREAVRWLDANGQDGFTIIAFEAGQVLPCLQVRRGLRLDGDPHGAERVLNEHREGLPMKYYAIEFRNEFPDTARLGRVIHERRRAGGRIFRIFEIVQRRPS